MNAEDKGPPGAEEHGEAFAPRHPRGAREGGQLHQIFTPGCP